MVGRAEHAATKDMLLLRRQSMPPLLCRKRDTTSLLLLLLGHQAGLDIYLGVAWTSTGTKYSHRLLTWSSQKFKGKALKAKAAKIALVATVYHIWQAHNSYIFENIIFVSRDVVHRIPIHVYRVMYKLFPHILGINDASIV